MKPSHIFFSLLLPFTSTSIAETIQLSSAGATIPIDYLRNQTSILSQFSPSYTNDQEVVSHLSSRLQTCIAQAPSDHGLIFHIEDQSDEPFSIEVEEQGEDLSKRGVIRSMHKGWKAMPFDQRLAVVGSVAATAAVPMYLIGAGIGFNEYEISNLKEKLVSSNKTHHLSQNVLPPAPPYAPPAMKMGHRKRSWTETVQSLVKRGPPTTGKKIVKQPKVRNAKVDSVLGMVGVGNSFLYLGTAAVGMARSMAVRDSDTASYKRSVPQEMSGFTVNCIPVQKVGDMDFQIPKGGLNGKTKQLTYIDVGAGSGNGASIEIGSSGLPVQDVAATSLANGHSRVLVKRAAIPPREYDHNPSDSDAKQVLLTSSHRPEADVVRAEQQSLHDGDEQPFARRQHPHAEGKPHGEGPHADGDGPVHVMKVKHIHHVDPNAPKPNEKGHSVAPVKKKSNKKTALALAAGGAVVGAIGHSMYQSNLQQQQAAQAAAAAQAQVYGDDEAMYLPQDGQELPPPPTRREYTSPDDFMVKRSVSLNEDSLGPLSKRSPGGGKPKPDIVIEKHIYNHYNVHPNHVPAGAIHLNSEGGRRAPSSHSGFPEPVPPPGSGPSSGPEAEHYYVTSDGNKFDHEKKNGEIQGHPKKKKMSLLKKGAILTAGAMAGAWGHAAFFPAAAPPAQVQGYYDDGTPVYRKRDLAPMAKERSQMPMSIDQSAASSGRGTFEYHPDYLEYYNHLAKRDFVKRKTISYDDYVQSLKKIVEEDDDSDGKKVPGAVVQPAKLPTTPPSKRDEIDYDSDGKNTHFSAQRDGNLSEEVDVNGEEEEPQPHRRDSNITFDTDDRNGVHFHASGPPASSKAAAANVNEKEPSPDEGLRRRADPVKIEYESDPDGSQWFSANAPVNKKGADETVGEEDPVVLRRRSDVQNIQFDHSKTGSHFAVTMKNNAEEEDESPDLKELKEMLQRRDHDGDHHHDIDYRTSKDNEVVFHASTPYPASNDAQAGSKEKGITIKIVPRSEDEASTLVRRNRIVADR